MQRETKSRRVEAVRAHPVAELLECPPSTGLLLNGSAQPQFPFRRRDFSPVRELPWTLSTAFREFMRRTERLQTRLLLAPARAGDLVELAAALGDGQHTYTLIAQSAGFGSDAADGGS